MSETKKSVVEEIVNKAKIAELSDEEKELIALEKQSKELEVQLKQQQLEAAKLEQEERKFHIQDLKARLAERELTEKQRANDLAQRAAGFRQEEANDKFRWNFCTHKKGGNVSPTDMKVLHFGGNKEQYAVLKHMMINGDIWVLCLRCGKTWKPPVETSFFFDEKGQNCAPQDGKFDKVKFEKAQFEYMQAVNFNTNNSMSASVQCRFTTFDPQSGKNVDATDIYRENVRDTTLR